MPSPICLSGFKAYRCLVTMKANPTCRVCSTELNEENWYPSRREGDNYICKKCDNERRHLWRKANPDKADASNLTERRKRGVRSFKENQRCSAFLGVHIAEQVLSKVFKDVVRMPYGNPGFDVICNRKKKIDIKSACQRKDGKDWMFTINHNTTADFFLCLAFNNRKDLTPLHAWLLPGCKFNHLIGTTISPSTIYKWDEYRLDISKIDECCDTLRKQK